MNAPKTSYSLGSQADYFLHSSKSMQGEFFNFSQEFIDDYRYGFNGKEKLDEVSGNGNVYDYGFRIYNPRLGKFLSEDPLTSSYPWYTPYQFAGNMPIIAIDLDGLEEFIIIDLSNGYLMAVWDVTAKSRDQGGTIMYISDDPKISSGIRKLNYRERNNQFIKDRMGVPLDSPNIIKTGVNTKYSEGYPSTLYKNYRTGNIEGEQKIKKEELIVEPPKPVIPPTPSIKRDGPGSHDEVGEKAEEVAEDKVPSPMVIVGGFRSWSNIPIDPAKMKSSAKESIEYLIAHPEATITITITTNGGSADNTDGWNRKNGSVLLGDLVDNRNDLLEDYLIEEGVDPSQINKERGSPTAGTSTKGVITPAP